MARLPTDSKTTDSPRETSAKLEAPWWHEVPKLVLTGAFGALATIVVGYLTFFNAGRELDLKMVDVSLAILSGEKGGIPDEVADQVAYDEYYEARRFALRALERYSGVPIEEDAKERWARSGKISFGRVPTSGTSSELWFKDFVASGGWAKVANGIIMPTDPDMAGLLDEAATWPSAASGACELARRVVQANPGIMTLGSARPLLVTNCGVEDPDAAPSSAKD